MRLVKLIPRAGDFLAGDPTHETDVVAERKWTPITVYAHGDDRAGRICVMLTGDDAVRGDPTWRLDLTIDETGNLIRRLQVGIEESLAKIALTAEKGGGA